MADWYRNLSGVLAEPGEKRVCFNDAESNAKSSKAKHYLTTCLAHGFECIPYVRIDCSRGGLLVAKASMAKKVRQ